MPSWWQSQKFKLRQSNFYDKSKILNIKALFKEQFIHLLGESITTTM